VKQKMIRMRFLLGRKAELAPKSSGRVAGCRSRMSAMGQRVLRQRDRLPPVLPNMLCPHRLLGRD
jgi:hypothetical protein